MIDMLEPAQFLFISLYVLKSERRNRWIISNGLLLVCGVIFGLGILPAIEGVSPIPLFTLGAFFLWLGGLSFVFNEVITQLYLETIPLGIYGLIRVAFAVIFYHVIVIFQAIEEGSFRHINDLYAWDLWLSMSWYVFVY